MERLKEKVKIINKLGMHARAASVFVELANQFEECDIFVSKDGETVNGKSIMGLISLAAVQNTVIEIECRNQNASQALEALVRLVNDRFGEDE